jgi:hypothetical protein
MRHQHRMGGAGGRDVPEAPELPERVGVSLYPDDARRSLSIIWPEQDGAR